MTTASNNDYPSILLTEQGSAPTSPAASHQRMYIRTSDHTLVTVNSSGIVTPVSTAATAFMGARAIRTTTQNITTATVTAIGFDSETSPGFDTGTIHDTATNNSRFTVPTGGAGKWTASGGGVWDTNVTSVNRYVWWRLNGSTDVPGSAVLLPPSTSGLNEQAVCPALLLADADYLEMVVYQDSGGTRTFGAGSLGVGSAAASVWRLG